MVAPFGPVLSPVVMLITHDPTVPLNMTQVSVPPPHELPRMTPEVDAPLVNFKASVSACALVADTHKAKTMSTPRSPDTGGTRTLRNKPIHLNSLGPRYLELS